MSMNNPTFASTVRHMNPSPKQAYAIRKETQLPPALAYTNSPLTTLHHVVVMASSILNRARLLLQLCEGASTQRPIIYGL